MRQLDSDGRWCGSAAIESWRGTPEELVDAARTLVRLLGVDSDLKVTVSLANGCVVAPTTLEELQRRLSDAPEQVLVARVQAAVGNERAVLVAASISQNLWCTSRTRTASERSAGRRRSFGE